MPDNKVGMWQYNSLREHIKYDNKGNLTKEDEELVSNFNIAFSASILATLSNNTGDYEKDFNECVGKLRAGTTAFIKYMQS